MTYSVYIKKDYKPDTRWIPEQPWYVRKSGLLVGTVLGALLVSGYAFYPEKQAESPLLSRQNLALPTQPLEERQAAPAAVEPITIIPVPAEPARVVSQPKPAPKWQTIEVRKGDNLSLIFERMKLGPTVLYQVLSSGEEAKLLKNLLPGQKLEFLFENKEFVSLRFEPSITRRLQISQSDEGFISQLDDIELDRRSRISQGEINSSLFLAGQAAGLSDNLIMQLVAIFGWDIDFVLDIRKGDAFKVVFEELYRDNEKIGDGAILAAEFSNQKQHYRAVRYTSPEGNISYFNEKGISMRKAFLRTPLKFSRISSRFNLRRKHPVLNRIRAHRGVDYAAPTGTPIKSTGDGKVVHAGRKGGYGRTVIIKHGGSYKTLYAHMSSISRKIKRGARVKQGQVIGYVGKSGLATGPHLHYEFQVNGTHRNPLTVKLPKAASVAGENLDHFKQQTSLLLAQLESDRHFAALDASEIHTGLEPAADKTVLAASSTK